MTRFFVVVPTRNSARFLGRALASLLEAQPGAFHLHVRVQDGASEDGTLEIARAWEARVAAGGVPDAARRRITVASARDGGLYDAVGAGFGSPEAEGHDVLGWLGSDDLLLPGALATVSGVLGRFPRIRWITGQPQVIDEDGAWFGMGATQRYASRDVRRGLHDGRALRFIQQEGTFWRDSLYREAGGLRRELRLAGDFDLFRRFARTDDLVTCTFPLGAWRQRRGQASGDLAEYYREVDRITAEDAPAGVEAEAGMDGPAQRFRPVVLDRAFGGDWALREDGLPFLPLSGFGPAAPASPADGLHASSIGMVGPRASLQVPLLEGGARYRFALRLRSGGAGGRLTVRCGDGVVHETVLRPGPRAPAVIPFTFAPPARWPVLTLEHVPGPAARGARWLARHVGGRRAAPAGLLVEDLMYERCTA